MAEEIELKGKQLANEISRIMLRIGSKALKARTVEEKLNLNNAIGMLNHAQGMIELDANRARRLLGQVRRLANLRE